jgi:Zn-dependent protease
MANEIVLIVFYVAILLYSVIIHEVMHGVAALWLGDLTAKYAGRITANPMKHVDPITTVLLPLMMFLMTGFAFGMAKPVPYNPYNLKNQKWGPSLVALAGPISNLFLALVAAITARILPILETSRLDIFYSFKLAISSKGFGLDAWSKLGDALHSSFGNIFFGLLLMVIFWNVLLAVFNLIPIPPLDGSKVLYGIFPIRIETMAILEQYGFMLLFLVIILDAFTFNILGTVLNLMWGIFFSVAL